MCTQRNLHCETDRQIESNKCIVYTKKLTLLYRQTDREQQMYCVHKETYTVIQTDREQQMYCVHKEIYKVRQTDRNRVLNALCPHRNLHGNVDR